MSRLRRWGAVLLLGLAASSVYTAWTYSAVRAAAVRDEAVPSDVIVVLGAAQYNGRPSPVFKARLDHAIALFTGGHANVIITTGGFGPDPNYSEAHVGARYLSENGIDASQIVVDQGSGTTYDTVRAVSGIMRSNGWTRAVAVSDGFHLYRLKTLFADNGIDARTSPVPNSLIEATMTDRVWFSLREVVLISLYRAGSLLGLLTLD
jgi:uncharacterized SAM-binding protein YcdF (DUF218 family)